MLTINFVIFIVEKWRKKTLHCHEYEWLRASILGVMRGIAHAREKVSTNISQRKRQRRRTWRTCSWDEAGIF